MEPSAEELALAFDLETALTGLIKLTKALTFYPADHPALTAAAEETCDAFRPLLERHDTRPYHVTQDGFNLDTVPLAPKNLSLKKLAVKLVERKVRHLLFLPELTNFELLIFAEQLSRPTEQLLKTGGLIKHLAEQKIKSIWINETDLEAVLKNLYKMENGQPEILLTENEPSELPAQEQSFSAATNENQTSVIEQMRDLLEHLKEPQEDHVYAQLLDKIRPLADDFLRQTGLIGCLALIGLLETQRKDKNRNHAQQQGATDLTDRLLDDAIKTLLVNAVAEYGLKPSQRRALGKLLVGLELKIVPELIQRLNAERDAILRRYYTAILAKMGEATFARFEDILRSDIWYRVRNAVTVLGETRLETALPLLERTIDYPEVRVRRAVIRALGAIGSNAVIPLLLQLAHDENTELHQPAIMALGTLGNPQAIPPLVEILKKRDIFGKKTGLKIEVIQALVATKSPQAIIPLLKLARRANMLNSAKLETLRAEAIIALGQLGNSHLIPVLDQLPKSDKGPVSRALKQATAQLKKAQNVV